MRFVCRLIGHTEGMELLPGFRVLRATNHKCWRCGEEVPKKLRSEFLTAHRIRWW